MMFRSSLSCFPCGGKDGNLVSGVAASGKDVVRRYGVPGKDARYRMVARVLGEDAYRRAGYSGVFISFGRTRPYFTLGGKGEEGGLRNHSGPVARPPLVRPIGASACFVAGVVRPWCLIRTSGSGNLIRPIVLSVGFFHKTFERQLGSVG
jgi:hypothetical protein